MILLLNLVATWFMVGLIWLIQLVHYRQFDLIGEGQWTQYHRDHSRRITWIVAPVMLVEGATAVALVVQQPSAVTWIALALLVVIWLSTACLQVPLHRRLATAFDAAQCHRLTAGNWVRTVAWSSRGVLMAYMMWQALHGA